MSQPNVRELAKQLRKPEGELGIQVAEQLNKSNIHLTTSTYHCMEVKDGEQILEIGFGNGKLMPLLPEGKTGIFLAGIDFSETMVQEAKFHLREQIEQAQIEIKLGSVSGIPYHDERFDKVCTINTLYFWENPAEDAREILRVLKPGGKLYIGIRPKEEAKLLEVTKYGFTLYDPEEAVGLLLKADFSNAYFILQKDPPVLIGEKEYTLTSCCIVGER